MIRDYLTDIIKAKENGAYFSALALALPITDVCGKIEGIGKMVEKNTLNGLINGSTNILKSYNRKI